MSLTLSNGLYKGFINSFAKYMDNNDPSMAFRFEGIDLTFEGIDSSFEVVDSNWESQSYVYSSVQENELDDSQAPAELKIYAFPSCFGSAITPAINDGEERALARQYPEKYHQLEESKKGAKEAVIERYGLYSLTRAESYLKTHGLDAKEMTDYYYSQFDQEGQALIKFFYPEVAEKYRF